MSARYLVGIDLGTTNSALAYVDLKVAKARRPELHAFPVPQLIAPGEVAPRELLPSFLYRPGQHDLPPGATALPWDKSATDPVGEFAREHGAKIPGRLVSSAKSWLCHPGVDRTAALLPWGAPPDVPKLSPLEASARYLKHLVDTWNHAKAKTESERLEKLPVVLTVPASFDDVARTLTVEAAKQSGLLNITLLEEPQAAFYCWQHLANDREAGRLKPGMNCLVVDVGGGTSDFSLIAAVEEQGELVFVRQAVGDHLLLGGDNMDLAIAKHVEAKLPTGKLDAVQFAALVQACRRAKERLLAPDAPSHETVTVVGRGRSVVGGAISVSLTADDVHQVIYDGFFPHVQPGDQPQRAARTGLHEMGLPYVHDPAVTRHLAAFLSRHLSDNAAPEAILFNGGVFQPESLRQRLLASIQPWYEGTKKKTPIVLTTPSLDLAVAYGAAAYAWIKHTGGRAIGGGTARSYYIEVGSVKSSNALSVLCVVPRHAEENIEISIPQPELELALGEPVVFPLHTSTARDDQPGQLIDVSLDQLRKLPPLQTVLRPGKRSSTASKRVPVTLAARATAIGTLELSCVAKDGGTRWRLEFSTRDLVSEDDEEEAAPTTSVTELLPETVIAPAVELIGQCYTSDTIKPNELTRALESTLEMPRDEWPTAVCRRLWEPLAAIAESRRRSPGHLSRWYNLVGFCLRPGFGDALDKFRVDSLWKILHAPKAGQAAPSEPVGADAWIMWRRSAGGLHTSFQKTLFDRLRPVLFGGKSKTAFKPGANELAEMWRAAAAMERLDAKTKSLLGDALIKQIGLSGAPTYAFWSLTRFGARSLLYGPLNAVVHQETASHWLDAILPFQPGHDSERLAWAFCLAELARRTGQRALDIDESRRKTVLAALQTAAVPETWRQIVAEVIPRTGAERAQIFGDSLPVGLRLRG
jgi:molecular chaperone DnaK (HSP70)